MHEINLIFSYMTRKGNVSLEGFQHWEVTKSQREYHLAAW